MSLLYVRGIVRRLSTATLVARVVNEHGENVTWESLASASYTIYEVDPAAPNSRTPVAGHEGIAIPVDQLINDVLQKDALWGNTDDVGYNLKHVLDVSASQAFQTIGKTYLVEFTLVPNSGQVLEVPFLLPCEDDAW